MSATLRPLTAAEFDGWAQAAITSYAMDLARATGSTTEETLPQVRDQFAGMLPDGLGTASTWLFAIVDSDGRDAGTLWLGPSPQSPDAAYVYDIIIDESRRGEGLGRAAMLLAEGVLRDAGYTTIQLSVFGFNAGARQLYDSLGYTVVSTSMAKPLQR